MALWVEGAKKGSAPRFSSQRGPTSSPNVSSCCLIGQIRAPRF